MLHIDIPRFKKVCLEDQKDWTALSRHDKQVAVALHSGVYSSGGTYQTLFCCSRASSLTMEEDDPKGREKERRSRE